MLFYAEIDYIGENNTKEHLDFLSKVKTTCPFSQLESTMVRWTYIKAPP